MIRSFRHKGRQGFYEEDSAKGLSAGLVPKIGRILALLDVATQPEAMNLPGYRLHPLKGNLAGVWSVTVNRNWRIIFRLEGGDAWEVDLLDFH